MKAVQHAGKKDVFADWVNANLGVSNDSHIYSPQITYDWRSENPIHIVFERNTNSFNWPWCSDIYLPYPFTNIDFTATPPLLDDGTPWDYENWFQDALQCTLKKVADRTPDSFWDWRLMTWPQGNATCDLDVLHKKGDIWVGIEATEIWYVDENESDHNQDCYQHVHNLIHKRKAFNFKALRAQCIFMDAIGGEHYFVLHQIDKSKGQLVAGRVMVLPLDMATIDLLEHGTGNRDEVKKNLGHHFRFQSLNKFFGL